VELSTVDETVLALVDLALEGNGSITVVYPAPAGEVSVLLAAQIVIRRFVQGEPSQSVGIVTWDTTGAMKTWEQLAVSTTGLTAWISEVFPAFRAGPDGEIPLGRSSFQGVIIGRQFRDWPVDVVVVDHLSGPVRADPPVPTVRVFADPSDPELERLAGHGELLWGWTEADLALLARARPERQRAVPFSVASERLRTMAGGVEIAIHVAHHAEAEKAVRRLRDDLRTLSELAGPEVSLGVLRGMKVAWHHVSALSSLPCRPSVFDRFAGLPPIAARATCTFEPEIAAWARTLPGDLREVGEIVASDLGDLRAALEEAPPFIGELAAAVSDGPDALVVVRSRTAARALIESLDGDVSSDRVGRARVVPIYRLHREGTWARAIVVGTPARWDWHRLDSGLSPDVHVLALGDLEAHLGRMALEALRKARARWSGKEVRRRTWRALVGSEPPPGPQAPTVPLKISMVGARAAAPPVDSFEPLQPLLASVPLAVGEEGVEDVVGEESPTGAWRGAVEAVEVVTEAGSLFLPRDRLVDVREGEEVVERRAAALRPGMVLLVDRRGRRLGLLEAVSDQLEKARPDLFAAKLLIEDLRRRVQQAFRGSGTTVVRLFEQLRALGCRKSYGAVRSWVDEDGPVAPRDLRDLELLNEALALGMSSRRLRETFAGVSRWRGFRRAVGRALAEAARGSVGTARATRIDSETGLSVADLRELVLEAKVLEVRECPEPVPLSEIGYLKER
jgi:hypothetical protein